MLYEGKCRVRQYFEDKDAPTEKYLYYRREDLIIEFNDAAQSICITSPDFQLMTRNAVAGKEMKIVSYSPEKVVFEVHDLKPFIVYAAGLDYYIPTYYPGREYLGLQVTWDKVQYTQNLEDARKSGF